MAVNASLSESHSLETIVEVSSNGKTETKYSVHCVKQKFCNYHNPHFRIPSYPQYSIPGQINAHIF